MLKLDRTFDRTFKSLIGVAPVHENIVEQKCNDIIIGYQKEYGKFDINLLNTIKAADITGLQYDDILDPGAFINMMMPDLYFALTLVYLHSQYPIEMSKYIQYKRNYLKEAAAIKYGVEITGLTDTMLKDIDKIKTKDTYSVALPMVNSRDEYFYNICRDIATNSKCHSRKIGAVLAQGKRAIATGYNGPPRGVPTCDQRWYIDEEFRAKYGPQADGKETKGICPRRVIGFPSGQGLDICPAGHAERNALINAAAQGISTIGTTLYMTCGVPCTPCLVEIINAEVKEIVVSSLSIYDSSAKYVLENSDLKIRLFDFL